MSTINLETELIARNEATLAKERKLLDEQAKIDALVDNMLQIADENYRDELLGTLGFDYKIHEAQAVKKEREQFKHLPAERIFDLSAIKATCIEYGLRCLPTRHFKGQLDSRLGAKLEEFKRLCGGELPKVDWEENLTPMDVTLLGIWGGAETARTPRRTGFQATQFFICAPADQFVLQDKPKDPLLFCRLSMDKFFLLHKWGDDLETAHLRVGQTTERNWNSVYKPEPVAEAPLAGIAALNQRDAWGQYRMYVRAQEKMREQAHAAKKPGLFAKYFNSKMEE